MKDGLEITKNDELWIHCKIKYDDIMERPILLV